MFLVSHAYFLTLACRFHFQPMLYFQHANFILLYVSHLYTSGNNIHYVLLHLFKKWSEYLAYYNIEPFKLPFFFDIGLHTFILFIMCNFLQNIYKPDSRENKMKNI